MPKKLLGTSLFKFEYFTDQNSIFINKVVKNLSKICHVIYLWKACIMLLITYIKTYALKCTGNQLLIGRYILQTRIVAVKYKTRKLLKAIMVYTEYKI